MKQKELAIIDIMKLICVLLIICMNTNMFSSLNTTVDFIVVQLLSKIAYPLFFITTSFCFFKKIDFSLSLANSKNMDTLFQFLAKIIKFYVLWTLLYLPLLIIQWMEEGFTIMTLLYFLRDFIFVGSYVHLWIFPALLFAIVFVYYMLRKWHYSELFVFAFVVYLIGMLINVYGTFLLEIPILSSVIACYLNIFSTSVNGLFFALIYVLLAYQLARKKITIHRKTITIRWILSTLIYIMEVSVLYWLGYANVQTHLYLFAIPVAYYLLMMIMTFSLNSFNKEVQNFGTLLYMIQFYVIFLCSRISFIKENAILSMICVIIFSCLISYIFIKVTKKQKKLKRLYIC